MLLFHIEEIKKLRKVKDETLKDYLYNSVKLRTRYIHDYYKRDLSEKPATRNLYGILFQITIQFVYTE